jgi:RimJ/RimL family protein N-acetyltransferase
MTPFIRTSRLTLRPVVPEDAEAIEEAVNNWAVAKWLAVVPHPYSLDDAHEFITEIALQAGPFWAIDDGGLIGIISLGQELGYWLAEDRWGRGYMTEAARAVIFDHFADPDAGDILSGYFVANERSGHVLQKLGFKPGKERRMYCVARGEEVDSQDMFLTRQRWQDLSNRDQSATAGA